MVSLSHTVANPRTVMIMYLNTGIAIRTVERSRRFIDFTSSTHVHIDILAFNVCIILMSISRGRYAFLK